MKVKRPISTRLAVVMVLSLAFELGLMGWFYLTVKEGMNDRQVEAKASNITWQINTCVIDALTMAISFTFVQFTDSPIYKTRLKEAMRQASEGLDRMAALVAGEDPALLKEADSFMSLIREQKEWIARTTGPALPGSVELNSPGNFASESSFGEKMKVLRFLLVYQKLTVESARARERLLSLQAKAQDLRSKRHDERSSRNLLVLQCAVVASILICLTMGLILYRSIALRLKRVRTNAEQFGADLKIDPLSDADDEIDEVNRLFLQMTRVLKETRHQEEMILESASSIICTIDPEGRILTVNSAAKKLWGLEPDALRGLRLNRHMTEVEAQGLQGHLKRIARDGRGSFETKMELPNSVVRDIEWTVSSLDANNCFVCIAHDVTEKNNLENLKREFAEIIHSNLSESLNSVRLVLSKIREQSESSAMMLEKASNTMAVVDRLSSLVSHMTELSGATTASFALVPASLLVQRAASSLTEWAQARGVSIVCAATDARLYVDEERIVRVLINLISNAVKFSESGSTVHVSAREENQYIGFSVTDHGPGIDEAYRELIFQRFEQIEDESGKIEQGAGLGLAICRSIIDEHDGELGVDTVEPRGSCFWFRIKGHKSA